MSLHRLGDCHSRAEVKLGEQKKLLERGPGVLRAQQSAAERVGEANKLGTSRSTAPLAVSPLYLSEVPA